MADSSNRKQGVGEDGLYSDKKIGIRRDQGIYLAEVVGHVTGTRMGELYVTIPDWDIPGTQQQSLTVGYASPFYGTTYGTDKATNPDGPMTAGQSYGMWMVPPDIGNKVLVVFTGGDSMRDGYWFACVYQGSSHHMVPGLARNIGGAAKTTKPNDGIQKYLTGSSQLPVVEFDIATNNPNGDLVNTPRYPHEYQSMRLITQGLDTDPIRGAISSSSLRESPSNVYGISTPGRKITAGDQDPTNPQKVFARKGGHSLVMDDGDGKGNDQLIRLRTTDGHQILMNDTNNVLYIGSASGNQWLEFSQNGQINVYGIGGFNLRTKGPMNFHSDSSIMMDAKSVTIQGQISTSISSGGSLSLGSAGKASFGAGGAVTIAAGGYLTMASLGVMDIGAGGVVSIDGTLLKLNSGKPPAPIPPTPPLPKTHVDTVHNTRWEATGSLISICKTVPAHEPWARPDATPGETTIATAATETASAAPVVPVTLTTKASPTATATTAIDNRTSLSFSSLPTSTSTGSTFAAASVTTATSVAGSGSGTSTTVNGTGTTTAGTGTTTAGTGTTTTGNTPTTAVYPTLITKATVLPASNTPKSTVPVVYTFVFDKPAPEAFQINPPAFNFVPSNGGPVIGAATSSAAIQVPKLATGFSYTLDVSSFNTAGSIQLISNSGSATQFSTQGTNGGNPLTLATGVAWPTYQIVTSSTGTTLNTSIVNPLYPSAFTVTIDNTSGKIGYDPIYNPGTNDTGFTYTVKLDKPAVTAFTVILNAYFQPASGAAIQLADVPIKIDASAQTFTYRFDLTTMTAKNSGQAVPLVAGTAYLQNLPAYTGFMTVSGAQGTSASTPPANGGNNLSGVQQFPVHTISSINTPAYLYPTSYTVSASSAGGLAGNSTGVDYVFTLNRPAVAAFTGKVVAYFNNTAVGQLPVSFATGSTTFALHFDVTKLIAQNTAGTLYIAGSIYVDNGGNNNTSITGPKSDNYVIAVPPSAPVLIAETITVPTSMNTNVPFTFTIKGNANDTFVITQGGTTVLSDKLDASGNYTYNNSTGFVTAGTYVYVTTFTATKHVFNNTIAVTAAAPPVPVYTNAISGYPSSIEINRPFTVQVTGTPNDTVFFVSLFMPSVTVTIGANGTASATLMVTRIGGIIVNATFSSGPSKTFPITVTANGVSEVITGPSSVMVNQPYDVSITGGAPGDTFFLTGGVVGNGVLDGSGSYHWTGLVQTAPNPNLAITVAFTSTGHTRNYNLTVTEIVYNESVIGPSGYLKAGAPYSASITGGKPSTNFYITDGSGNIIFPSTPLDGNGSYTQFTNIPAPGATATYTVHFEATGHTRTITVLVNS